MNLTRSDLIAKRNQLADAAYDKALAPARRALNDTSRVPYPDAIKTALAAYDSVIVKYQPMLWPQAGA